MPKIRIRHGENEIELDGDMDFITSNLKSFYERLGLVGGKTSPATLKQDLLSLDKPKEKGITPTPVEFYKSKGKTDGISQVLIFGKYLEQYMDKPEFTRADVNSLTTQAKFSKDIHSQYYTNAVKQGLLRMHDGGKYSLTLSAEELLASM
ncbi:hypothetical protein ANAEL_04201 [Anaerolineales bacterium]|nr:hypothetical protein ANAEL_04201 [Anaerolineales bacterium]